MKTYNDFKIKNLILPILGLVSLIWFLVRVIPKPSRANYPCMKASAPFASSFVLYLIGLASSVFIFKKSKIFLRNSNYLLFCIAMVVSLVLGIVSYFGINTQNSLANIVSDLEGANVPLGEGVGIFPGRVVWIYNRNATDENCTNQAKDYWFLSFNTKQDTVNKMFADGIMKLTSTSSEEIAWDSIFHYYNRTHGRGDVGYTKGEKIVMKINMNGDSYTGTTEEATLKHIDTSPQTVVAILSSLVYKVGVAQTDITFGDPGRSIALEFWSKFNKNLTEVKYWGPKSVIPAISTTYIHSSDGTIATALPRDYIDAAYMINVPVLKKHHRAGISLCSKNHFGTIVAAEGSAFGWHFSLPCSDGMHQVTHGKYGEYRCFVDIMGHKDLGGKTILYVIDGLWGSTNWAHPPIKWRMTPFNNDWPNSLFLSQDPVAIESVGLDFLFNEFTKDHPTEGNFDATDDHGPFPHFPGVDDFLHQAADSKNWPVGITYDPEKDGTPLPSSMGAHEHWNNAVEKKYSRNLGMNRGIELVASDNALGINNTASNLQILRNSPNPFNSFTNIEYSLPIKSDVTFMVYDVHGQEIYSLLSKNQTDGKHTLQWNGIGSNNIRLSKGMYFGRLTTGNNRSKSNIVKMVLN
jgi:hypothetical protein